MIRTALAVAGALVLGACGTDLSALELALAKDPSAVCIRITTLYGSAEFNRNWGCSPTPVATPTLAVAK